MYETFKNFVVSFCKYFYLFLVFRSKIVHLVLFLLFVYSLIINNNNKHCSILSNFVLQGKFKVIDRYLQQTVAKLLDCTKLITSASEIICFVKPIETSTVFTPVSSNTPYCPLDTTPPPEESDKMEVTTAEVVPMETTCVELGFIDAITELHQLTQRGKMTTCKKFTLLLISRFNPISETQLCLFWTMLFVPSRLAPIRRCF